METDYVKVLSAGLTPMLGVLTAYIAWQQWRTNALKLRHDLYERRLAVYLAVMEFLGCVVRSAKASDAETGAFLQKTRESYFLFGPAMAEYLDSIYKRSVDLQHQNTMLHDPASSLPIGDERKQLARESKDTMKWFTAQFNVAREKFASYMSLA